MVRTLLYAQELGVIKVEVRERMILCSSRISPLLLLEETKMEGSIACYFSYVEVCNEKEH